MTSQVGSAPTLHRMTGSIARRTKGARLCCQLEPVRTVFVGVTITALIGDHEPESAASSL
jgi:hypothetical protein